MIGLSDDIEEAVKIVIEGLNYPIDTSEIEPQRVSDAIASKTNSFIEGKKLILDWQNSENAPSYKKLKKYLRELVKAGDYSLTILRDSLRESIDYENLDAVNHKKAIASKTVILKGIRTMNSSIIELRNQLDADKINLKDNEFKRGYPEKFANGEFFPLSDYYKDWYDEKKDAIILDPKGTRGEMITLDGLNIILPKKPMKKHILFSDKPKKEQYWRRTPMPLGLTLESVEGYVDYIMEEFRRRREGVWFMNNGKAVYLTGSHYFALQWVKMEDNGGYMDFRFAQRNMYYFGKACEIDKRCLGQLFVKSRRTGYTYEKISVFLDESTSTCNANFGMTSKSDADARKAFSKFSYGFLNLPFFFQPIVKGAPDSKKALEFAKPSDKSKESKKKKDTNTDGYLNTRIDFLPTKDDAYDGQKMFRYLGDECFAKGTKILMEDLSFKNIEDVIVGDKVIVDGGKIIEVANTLKGEDDLYKVVQPYGKDYIVNSQHKLVLSHGSNKKTTKTIKITPVEYLNMSDSKKRITRRKVFSGIEFKDKDLTIDPYILGVWLGDGFSKESKFIFNHKKDIEILEEVKLYFQKNELDFYVVEEGDNYQKWYASDKNSIGSNQVTGKRHFFLNKLRSMGVLGNKRIPKEYFNSSINQRAELLSGIIDTDGTKQKNGLNSFSITMSRKDLIEDIYHISKSCGIDTSEVKVKKTNFNTICYTVRITDYDGILNMRVERKKSNKSKKLDRRSKMDVVPFGFGEYFGITLKTENEDNRNLVLEDYTVSKNCSKWKKPANYEKHWGQISPTFDEGGMIVGKAFIGSTVAAMKDGGSEFKRLYLGSQIKKRDAVTQRTPSGLYAYFLPAHKNMTEFTDKYGVCHEVVEKGKSFVNVNGEIKKIGAIQFLEARRKSKRKESDISYNEELRAFPMKTDEAFRDELKSSLFNTEKIISQIEFNEGSLAEENIVRGNFSWDKGIPDTRVVWNPNPNGRFYVSWIPPKEMQNRFETRLGYGGYSKFPLNGDIGAFGCDSYDISGTVEGVRSDGSYNENTDRASKGALHGLTKFTFANAPSNHFFLEYVARPKTAEMFFEDVLMACVFYGMPILAENNKPRLLYHFKNRGYRNFSITRFDKAGTRLSPTEKELGGMPNSSEDIKQMHAGAIESYIDKYVGFNSETGEHGNMPFNRTLDDWKHFDISNRTKFDASISSGLAIMAVNRDLYKPKQEIKEIQVNIKTYKH